ncbi:MAG: hypothetical protein JSV03_14955 [Planctomycetota bacterium]|nr:MAG: hypothetical protein JSV03_14955 [Planctomycetota bacterium]
MMELLGTLLIHPVVLGRWQQMLLLLPLCLTISIVYKTTKCEKLRDIPLSAVVSWVTIVIGMYAVGVSLLLLNKWIA